MDLGQPADVNWLLSAITQSAAALIAIVGGLLVSRYVALHAEQQGARRRADDLLRRQEEAEVQLNAHEREFDLYFVDEFLDDDTVFEILLRGHGDATVEQVLDEKDANGEELNRTLLEEQFAALQAEFLLAVQTLLPAVPVEKEHDDWLDFKRGKDLPIGHRGVWDWAYRRICDENRREAERVEEEARRKSPYGGLLGSIASQDILRSIRLGNPQVRALRGVVASQHEIAHINVLRGRLEAARAEVRALHQEHRLAEELFDATRQPEGFGLALQVLATLAVLGMGVPVVIMGFVPFTLPNWVRGFVVALFFFGVATLLRFLFVYANYLRGGRNGLPSWIGGLLKSDRTGR